MCDIPFICVTRLIHMCDFLHVCVWRHISLLQVRHVTHINELRHAYEWVMSHMRMSHVTHINQSCHTYEWVIYLCFKEGMSHIWMSYVTHINELRHIYEWVTSHISIGMSSLTQINQLACHLWHISINWHVISSLATYIFESSKGCVHKCVIVCDYVWLCRYVRERVCVPFFVCVCLYLCVSDRHTQIKAHTHDRHTQIKAEDSILFRACVLNSI